MLTRVALHFYLGKNIRIYLYHHFVQGQGNPLECERFAVQDFTRGAFNNVAASLAASIHVDRSSSIEQNSQKARLAKMASVAKVFLIFVVCCE